MSDMTSLSHEYAASSDFARQFNDAVLRLKKWQFAEPGIPAPSAKEVQEARQRLVQALNDLAGRLEARGEMMQSLGIVIPTEVADRLISKHKNQMPYFVQDLHNATRDLEGQGQIDLPAMGTLDEICDAADASASASFRRLRRR
ncbi:MAG: hypothetical protein ABSG67_18365 [Thermoguttaceae bacterium]|jgi:hypothetical protein